MIGWVICLVPVLQGQNVLPNPSFEDAQGNRPRGWRTETWTGQATFRHAQVRRTGNRSVEIASETGADVAWTATVAVDPFARYRLSGWIKTENLVPLDGGRGALLNIHGMSGVATRAVTGTVDWTLVETEFETEDQTSVQVNCLFGGWGQARGRAWFDDVALEKIAQREPPAPKIHVDAAQVGAPLSPLVYGQFIEHLGRCIYGGIWAEMLEDRKFYYPITPNYAPYTGLRDTPESLPTRVKGSPRG